MNQKTTSCLVAIVSALIVMVAGIYVVVFTPPHPVEAVAATPAPTQGARQLYSYAKPDPIKSVYPIVATPPKYDPTTCVANNIPGPITLYALPDEGSQYMGQWGNGEAGVMETNGPWTRIWILGETKGWVRSELVVEVPCQ